MILVGTSFKFAEIQTGREVAIDSDRKAQLLHDGSSYLLILFNGPRETRVSLTKEALEAVHALLDEAIYP